MKRRRFKNLRIKRVIGVTVFIVALLLAADFAKRKFIAPPVGTILVPGRFKPAESGTPGDGMNNPVNSELSGCFDLGVNLSSYCKVDVTEEMVYSGELCLVNESYSIGNPSKNMCSLYERKNEYYRVRDESLQMDGNAIYRLNQMMSDYAGQTGNINIVIYNTTNLYAGSDALYSSQFAEAALGYSLDLAVMGSDGVIVVYNSEASEGWMIENCYKYGFILPDPESPYHIRYVGVVHSNEMHDQGVVFESYVTEFCLNKIDIPVRRTIGDRSYEMYYMSKDMVAVTGLLVPNNGEYSISGNNFNGYIITVTR